MNYEQIYESLMGNRKSLDRVKNDKTYFESHHIIPRSMGGSDDNSNLVLLTAREHYVAHRLLAKIHPNNAKMQIALFFICQDVKNKGLNISSRVYESVRLKSVYLRKINAGHDLCIPFDVDLKVSKQVSNWTRHLHLGSDNIIRTSNILISNCLKAHQEDKYVSYSRNTHTPSYDYKKNFKISVYMIKKCLDILERDGWILNESGDSKDALSKRQVSRFKASEKLVSKFEDKIIV